VPVRTVLVLANTTKTVTCRAATDSSGHTMPTENANRQIAARRISCAFRKFVATATITINVDKATNRYAFSNSIRWKVTRRYGTPHVGERLQLDPSCASCGFSHYAVIAPDADNHIEDVGAQR
jgi:hypothetical protein